MPSSNEPEQFQLGATSDEAEMRAEVVNSTLPPPALANQQWQFPRASPDADISRDMHGTASG